MKLGAVLMASGRARRFGENKLLHPVDGVPMIERAMNALPPELFTKAAVVSAYRSILRLAEGKGYLAIPNPDPGQGQSLTVRLGTKALEDMDGLLFAVCDQPWLRRESVGRLIDRFSAQPDKIWALSWAGRKGNPVVFPKILFPELLAVTGDRGGGVVIKAHPELLCLVEADSPKELSDIDSPMDFDSQLRKTVISMYKIVKKQVLNPTVTLMEIEAPAVARKAEPGQFIILRVDENGERIPLTVADFDRERGTVTIIFQIVGATTEKLNHKAEGESIQDFVGPLGVPTHTEGLKKVAVVGGGVGCAIAYPIAKKLHEQGCEVHSIVGFRNKDLVILEDEFAASSAKLCRMSDDGSWGEKGLVTDALRKLIESGEQYDRVITIGPLVMMKFVCKLTKEFNVPTTVSMNPIMIDGTGMCGGCRLSLIQDGKRVTKFACVDGPDFDGHEVDFDEAMARGAMYKDFERHAYEETCNLFKGVESHA